MFKNLDPQDIKVKPFKTFKNFTFTNNDSGSGVYLVKARSGSFKQYGALVCNVRFQSHNTFLQRPINGTFATLHKGIKGGHPDAGPLLYFEDILR